MLSIALRVKFKAIWAENSKSWRVAYPVRSWSLHHLVWPALATSTAVELQRDEKPRSARLGAAQSVSHRDAFSARATRARRTRKSRYPSPSVEWRASRYVNSNRSKVDGVSRSAGTRTAGTRIVRSALSLSRCVVFNRQSWLIASRECRERKSRDVAARRADVRAFVEPLTPWGAIIVAGRSFYPNPSRSWYLYACKAN